MPSSKLAGRAWMFALAAVWAAPAAHAQTEYIDPQGGFTQVVTRTDGGVKTVFVSGQVGEGESFEAHVASAFDRVVGRLEQAGATVTDVAKIRIFVKDFRPGQYAAIRRARLATFPEGSWPASTMIGVQSLAAEAMRVEIEALAFVADGEGAGLEIERYAPSDAGYSGAVAVTANGVRTVYVAGHLGRGEDFGAQVASAWQRIGERLEAAGASLADLVKATTYIVDLDPARDLAPYREGRARVLGTSDLPASTLVGVPALAAEGPRIEVDAIAVVGADPGAPPGREFVDPAGGYTHVVATRGTGDRVLQVAGQVGTAGDPLEDQADQVYRNLRRRLEAAGASPSDLLKIVIYMPNYRPGDAGVLRGARERNGFPADALPAATLLGVQSLYSSEALLEIEGIAVVGR